MVKNGPQIQGRKMTTANAEGAVGRGNGSEQSATRQTALSLARMARVYGHLASVLLGGIFLASGVLHLENSYYFLYSVYSYEITGPLLGQFIAMVLPMVQLTIAACLLGRVCIGGALILSGALSCLFACVQVTGLWRNLQIDCGCFGPAYAQTIGTGSLVLASTLIVLAASAYVAHRAASHTERPL
jgi:hypothetical protein